jgi:riboflavin transporter FmnP
MIVGFFIFLEEVLSMTNKRTSNLVLTAVLSALGVVLMLIEIPYPVVPFLKFDLSDIVVLVASFTIGIIPALIIAGLKSIIHSLVMGPVGPAAIGQITAFVAGLTLLAGYRLSRNKMGMIKSLALMSLFFAVVMTVLNYLFITPIWFGGLIFLDVKDWVTLEAFGLNSQAGYLETIFIVYFPFNLIKGLLLSVVYFLLNRSLKIEK